LADVARGKFFLEQALMFGGIVSAALLARCGLRRK
jgi:hypothetical protein